MASALTFFKLVVVGLLIQVLFFVCVYHALVWGMTAGGVALVASWQPILVAVLAPLLVGERVSGRRWLGLLVGMTGTCVVIGQQMAVRVSSIAALVSAVAALCTMTAVVLYQRRFPSAHDAFVTNFVQYGVGLVATAPVAWLREGMQVAWSWRLGIALAYLVIANSFISVTLLLRMVQRGQASRVSAMFYLVPSTAALVAWLVLGEQLSAIAVAGISVAALGVGLASRG